MEQSKVFVSTAHLDYFKPSALFPKFQPNRTAEIQTDCLAEESGVSPDPVSDPSMRLFEVLGSCYSNGYNKSTHLLCFRKIRVDIFSLKMMYYSRK